MVKNFVHVVHPNVECMNAFKICIIPAVRCLITGFVVMGATSGLVLGLFLTLGGCIVNNIFLELVTK